MRLFPRAGRSRKNMAQKAKGGAAEQSDDGGSPLRLHREVWRLRSEEVELNGRADEKSKQTTTISGGLVSCSGGAAVPTGQISGGGGGVGTLRNTGRRNDNMRPYPSCAEDGRGTRSAWCAAASSNAPRWIRPGGWQRGAVDLRHRSLNHKLCMAGGGEGVRLGGRGEVRGIYGCGGI